MAPARGRCNSATAAAKAPEDAAGEAPGWQPAWRRLRAVMVFAAVVAAGAAADLVSKAVVFERLAESAHRSCTVVPRVLRFTLSTNPGIVFGLPVPGWLVLVATLAAAVTVVALFATSSRRRWGLHLALAMVLAGSLGNAYDRLFSRVHFAGEPLPRTHQVRDFIDFHVINYPVFNVADVLLVVGVLLILLQLHRQRRRLGPL